MNWQTLFGYSGTADWILLTAFHSLWIALAVFLITRLRWLRAPAVRSPWCTSAIILLLILPLITWFIPGTDVRALQDRQASVASSASTAMGAATAGARPPLLNRLLNTESVLPRARISQWKVPMNQFGLLWLVVTLGCLGRLLYQSAFLKGYCDGLQNVEDDRISGILQDINESFGFRRKPRFLSTKKVKCMRQGS